MAVVATVKVGANPLASHLGRRQPLGAEHRRRHRLGDRSRVELQSSADAAGRPEPARRRLGGRLRLGHLGLRGATCRRLDPLDARARAGRRSAAGSRARAAAARAGRRRRARSASAIVAAERRRQRRATSSRSRSCQRAAAAEEEREEEQVGQAEVRAAFARPGTGKANESAENDLRLLRDDRASSARARPSTRRRTGRCTRRARPSARSSKKREEDQTPKRHRGELREVRDHVRARRLQEHRPRARTQRASASEQRAAACPRAAARARRAPNDGRDQHEREERDVPPERQADHSDSCDARSRRRARRRARRTRDPRGLSTAAARPTTGPSALNAFQNVVFAGCSSSDASMSGT